MKIAVLGDSQIGSLKRGADMMPAHEMAHELRFFGARLYGLRSLQIQDRSLVPNDEEIASAIAFTSDGARQIDVDDYDAFLLYGLEARPFLAPIDHFYSSAVLKRAIGDVFKRSLSYETLCKLRAITDKPIYVGHSPMQAAQQNEGPQDTRSYEAGIAAMNESAYAPMGAVLLPQPIETIVNGNATALAHSQGSKRLAVGDAYDDELHPDIDINHMNDAFGRLWLKQFFATLA